MNLPLGLFLHCIVELENGNIFLAGGKVPIILNVLDSSPAYVNILQADSISNRAFIFVLDKYEWEEKARMSKGRYGHACGRIRNFANHKEEVIVAGGSLYAHQELVEIYSVPDNIWRSGNPLPHNIIYPSYIPFEDSFIIVGGKYSSAIYKVIKYSTGSVQHTVYKYLYLYFQFRRNTETWTKLKKELIYPDRGFVAMWVDRNIFPPC